MENTNGFAQATHKEVLDIKAYLYNLASRLDSICLQVQKSTFQTNMKGCDISEFFPVKCNEKLEIFMDRDHPEWESRKTEFYNFLFSVATNVKKGFARGLIKAMFSREYISAVKWPYSG